jgi:TonB family protein
MAARIACVLLLLPTAAHAGDAKRTCLRSTAPAYPPIARQMRVEGAILLAVSVDEKGHVTDAVVVSGHPMLAAAARQAVLTWQYTPATSPEVLQIKIDFKLPQ